MRYLTIFLLFFTSNLLAQKAGTYLDLRDNQTYQTVEIEGSIWFQEDLKFQTEDCFCQGKKKKKPYCKITNYYSNHSLSEVCPVDWHVATLSDWQKAIDFIMEKQQIAKSTIKIDTIDNGSIIKIFDRLALMGKGTTLLNFQDIGWVQGNRIRKKQNTTIWVYDEISQDDRFHVHYGNSGYVQHAHAHNIDGPAKERRRFAVRCVKN